MSQREASIPFSPSPAVNARTVLADAATQLVALQGHEFDVLDVKKPVSILAAVNLAKIISKLSPLVGNLIEFNTAEVLNELNRFGDHGAWERQDPGFPDTIFKGNISPPPGIEIKAWFPLSTEITARFKDSQNHFLGDNTDVAIIAWLPEHLIYGKPLIVDVCIVPALGIAQARDTHYHSPPHYLVVEPGDTASRTRNLRQTNTNGYVWQGSDAQLTEATKIVAGWGDNARLYRAADDYQALCRDLMNRFPYRLDTNFAKMDRIVHEEIEEFKKRVLDTTFRGHTVWQWSKLLGSANDAALAAELKKHLGIKEADAVELLE